MTDPVINSVVYYAERDGLIKIGCTQRLRQRLSVLQARLLATEPGGFDLEGQRHRQFWHLRVKGEWFEPAEELLEHIRPLAGVLTEKERKRRAISAQKAEEARAAYYVLKAQHKREVAS